jgi:glycosyltransferase involved in cell wall biosynthesis
MVHLGSRSIATYALGSHLEEADVVVCEYSVTNLTSWKLAFSRNRRFKLVLWGHGLRFGRRTNPLRVLALRVLGNNADFVAAYTDAGALALVHNGVKSPVLGVNNTFDWQADYKVRASGTRGEVDPNHFKGRALAYVGSIDEIKESQFLVQALDALWQLDRSVKVRVLGTGDSIKSLLESQSRGQTELYGRVDGPEKERLLQGVSGFFMPVPIGLVAIDAMALGVPIFTTAAGRHGPEIAYLTQGLNLFLYEGDASTFAREVLNQLSHSKQLRCDVEPPTLEDFTDNFIKVLNSVG